MLADQRAFNRVNIYVVGEFRNSAHPESPFFGITRDISCGGISFESQHYPLGPGDSLHCIFKDSRSDRVVSSTGEIVWKKSSDKFDCLTGVRFTDVDCSPENEVLKLLSAAGRVPLSAFLPGRDAVEHSGNAREQKNQPAHGGISAGSGSDNELAAPGYDVRALRDDAHGAGESSGFKGLELMEEGRSWIRYYLLPAIALFLIFAVMLTSRIGDRTEHDGPPEDVSEDIPAVTQQAVAPASEDEEDVTQESGEEQSPPGLISEAGKSDSGPAQQSPPLPVEKPLSGEGVTGGTGYYIQVGAWKNPSNASSFLKKLKTYYPDAYIDREGSFHKIKIPRIAGEREGARVISDIKKKFGISPILVRNRDGN